MVESAGGCDVSQREGDIRRVRVITRKLIEREGREGGREKGGLGGRERREGWYLFVTWSTLQ
jgi:hypothetical protein